METHELATSERAGGTKRILVVDDDVDVLEIVSEILRSLDYDVIQAHGPEEAVVAAEGERSIDLLLTDVRMPGLSGPDLARMLRARRPDLKVLLMTGYGGDVLGRDGVIDPEIELLEKPFTFEALSSRVEAMLRTPLELVH